MSENKKKSTAKWWLLGIAVVILAGALLLAAVLGGWAVTRIAKNITKNQTSSSPSQVQVSNDEGGGTSAEDDGGEGGDMQILLSEGKSEPQPAEALPVASGEELSPSEVAEILARLPELEEEEGDKQEFNMPDELVPPPLTGEKVEEAFPAEESYLEAETVESGPLEVLRFAPEGEIPIAPFVNVTFNQPMVPLGTLADLAEEDVPVILEPDLPGTWRWIGTRTVSFEADSEQVDRLPMATEFTVTVPAGTQSTTGGELAEAVSWTFSTPPVTMVQYSPYYGPQPLDPLFFISFDQRIDAEAVLKTIDVEADGKTVDLQMATAEEIEADKKVSRLVEGAEEARWLVFRAQESLPADAYVVVTVGPGTPSAEGPLLTKEAQSYEFETYAPLKVEDHGCSWGGNDCYPLAPFYIYFNNPLDVEAYEDSMITIEPALPGATVDIYGNTINIRGATQGRTTYRVTISGEISDTFGQQLGRDEKLTFKVGEAQPVLVGPEDVLVTLDPETKDPALSVYTINYNKLNVEIYAVEPSDWPAFKEYLQEYQRKDNPPSPPGRRVFKDAIKLDTPTDMLSEVNIELGEYMDGDYGHFVVIVESPSGLFSGNRDNYRETVHSWVQITQIGLDAFSDHSEMVVWTSALKDGSPLEGVEILTDKMVAEATSDAQGLSRFDLSSDGTTFLVARKGADQAFLPRSVFMWGDDVWQKRAVYDELRWYVFDDRQMYRPGEEVHVKGWLRLVGGGQDGDVGLVGPAMTGAHYTIIGSQGNELETGRLDVTELGGFDLAFSIPETVNLGYTQLILEAEGSLSGVSDKTYYHDFQIQEFRRPEFEVSARNETTGPYFAGEHAIVAVDAQYYAGGPLPNADVSWYVSSYPTNYSPPNWSDFSFGFWQPWWWGYEPGYESNISQGFEGLTDATGTHYLRMDFSEGGQPRALSVMAEASVMDVNRQAWASSTSLMVHPADLYVGLRSQRYFIERGDPMEIDLIVTDLDGNPVEDRQIAVNAVRLEWKYQNGGWQELESDLQECKIGSSEEPVTCTFETEKGGRYRITAEITDEQGRENMSQITRWVSGGQQPPARQVEQEEVTLIPDKETYEPGDTAEILVQAPFTPAEGLLTVSRSGILYTERFEMSEATTVLEIPIEEAHIPNLHVKVDLVGSAPRTDDEGEVMEDVPARPAYASGGLNLSIPPMQRRLILEAEPAETELGPGGVTSIDIVLKDAEGQAVSDAEMAVVVVDEAVLALTNYWLLDPVSVFYRERSSDVQSAYGRESIVLVDPMSLIGDTAPMPRVESTQAAEKQYEGMVDSGEMLLEAEEAPAAAPMEEMAADVAGANESGGAAAPIRVRSDFNPLAAFAPTVRTDKDGEASVEITLPDNLTRYRVMVVAVDESGKMFGSAEANLTARLPLMVRPSVSRFLNYGDQFEMPVVLQNQTNEDMEVEVAVQTTNIKLTDSEGQRVLVPAKDRVEVRFAATTDTPGTARFQIAAVSGNYADAAKGELPVFTPATTEAFATYGVVDEGAVRQPVASPTDVIPTYGGLEITTSSTALQALTDAVLYLVSYPFDCTEQMASRILSVAALRDVLTAFEADGLPSPEEMEASVTYDIERLEGLQNYDGGFPYWRRGKETIPYNSVHVAHALVRAEAMGFEVPEGMMQGVSEYLYYIEDHYPSYYSPYTRYTISAYALYVRDLMGDSDPDKARQLLNEAGLEDLSLEAVAWIWQVLVDDPDSADELADIRRLINNRAVETAGAANFTVAYGDQAYLLLHSNRRTDAVILDALIADNPESDLIPKVVNGLLAHRTRGRWGNTQENVFILLALDRYFDTYESQEPDFVARLWLGDTYAGSSEFSGYSTDRHQTDIPMPYLVDEELGGGETQDLVLSKEGTGRLYYRLGLRYAPADLTLDPLEMGFVVNRVYEAVDDPEDVYRDEDGVWHIKAGARVRVRLTMVADNRRYHVALVDPLPAGLEIVNPSLAVSGSVPQDPGSVEADYGWWWWSTWYEHQNMRDERAEVFTSLLWEGLHEYTYVARATMPGEFVVPPTKAEEMYSPEVFGRGSSDIVIVE